MSARGGFALGALGAIILGSSGAHAEVPDPCLTAPVEGQKLQRAGQLLEARKRFAVCGSNACPNEIAGDCTRWASELEQALPSIVLAARDDSGHDLTDVRASIDGGPLEPISIRAVPLDPGAHRVVFQRTGSAAIAYELIVREGEKNRRVTAVFRPVVSRSATPPGEPARRPIPNGVWIATTLGALSLASFGAFGVLGLSTRAARHCDTGCSAADKSTVDLELRAADVSLGVAAVALGIGAVLFFTRPAANRAASMRGGPIEIVW